MWRSSMFWQLFGTFSVLMLSSFVLLGSLVIGRVERFQLQQSESSLKTKAILVREAVQGRTREQVASLNKRVRTLHQEMGTRITLLAADGTVLADSEEDADKMENHADRPEVRQAQEERFGVATRFSRTLGQAMMYVVMRTEGADAVVAYVRVSLPLDHIHEELAGLRSIVWTTAGATGLASLVLAGWLARRITRPLQVLTRGAERISAGDHGFKVYPTGPDVIGRLARAFNHMSERLAAQISQLEEDRQQMRAVLSGMVEGVVALDAGQRILFANDRAAQLLDFPIDKAVGRKLWELVRQRSLQDLVSRAMTGPGPCFEELSWNSPGVKSLTIHASRLPGSPKPGALLVFHDTSELRRLERVRQEFVANVSHELKTPLSIIKANVETLLDGAVEDPQHRGLFLERIGEQSERLHNLILDLLSLARIESGAEAFEFQAVALGNVVTECLERHQARAEGMAQRLEATPPPEEAVAWADEEAVGQILDNLVDNALKYTPQGGRIGVRWQAVDGQVCLEIEDTGIGIAERDLPRIFERFYRADKARSRELGSTGLGLSIVKHLVQSMHGSVRAKSQLGKGTTFTIQLPPAPVA